jgi:hypothetical protein
MGRGVTAGASLVRRQHSSHHNHHQQQQGARTGWWHGAGAGALGAAAGALGLGAAALMEEGDQLEVRGWLWWWWNCNGKGLGWIMGLWLDGRTDTVEGCMIRNSNQTDPTLVTRPDTDRRGTRSGTARRC